MKTRTYVAVIFLSFVIVVLFTNFYYLDSKNNYQPIPKVVHSNGALPGYTGSPGDGGNDCTTCHAPGANYNASVSINSNIPNTGYVLGQTYQITVFVNPGSTAPTYGFQITAENSDAAKIGTWAITDTTAELAGGGTHVTHSARKASGTWSLNWTAPNTSQGPVAFYTALSAVNFAGGNTGDQTVKTQVSYNDISLDIDESTETRKSIIFPNPVSKQLHLKIPENKKISGDIVVFDILGKKQILKFVDIHNYKTLDVSNLGSGLYYLVFYIDGKRVSHSFLKN
jgi:Secretion system C-terminal sorting domain/Reeler domain